MKDELLKISQQAALSTAGRVLIELEPNYRYHNWLAQLVSVTSLIFPVGYVADMTLRVNGTVQRQLLPSEIDAIQALNNPPSATLGTAAATPYSVSNTANPGPAQLAWYFSEPWNQQYDAREAFALDLLPGDTATLEVGVISTAVAAPVVNVFADREPLSDIIAMGKRINRVDPRTGLPSTGPGSRPTLVKQTRFGHVPGAATTNITTLNRAFSQRDVIQHIRFTDPTGGQTIEKATITVNKSEIFKRTKFQNYRDLRGEMMNPSTGFFDWVPNASGDPRHGVEVGPNDDVNVFLEFSASATTNVAGIIQAFGPAN